jgi:hypothetical protein
MVNAKGSKIKKELATVEIVVVAANLSSLLLAVHELVF